MSYNEIEVLQHYISTRDRVEEPDYKKCKCEACKETVDTEVDEYEEATEDGEKVYLCRSCINKTFTIAKAHAECMEEELSPAQYQYLRAWEDIGNTIFNI